MNMNIMSEKMDYSSLLFIYFVLANPVEEKNGGLTCWQVNFF